jgi:hypothetical protein
VNADIEECHDRASRNPNIVGDMRARIDRLMQTFPVDIQDAWARTQAMPMCSTPAGCYPTSRT